MYNEKSIGRATLRYVPLMRGALAFSDFCAPSASLTFKAGGGFFTNNAVLFSLSFNGFEIEAKVQEGRIFFRRNGFYQHTQVCDPNGSYRVALQWEPDSIGCGVAKIVDDVEEDLELQAVRTEVTFPPLDLAQELRTDGLLHDKAFKNAEDLFITVVDCLEMCEVDIKRFGTERLLWAKEGSSMKPIAEPMMSRLVASHLAGLGAAKGFAVSCEEVAGAGNVDFSVSAHVHGEGIRKVAIEAKKADNLKIQTGLTHQLPAYMNRLAAEWGILLTYWLASAAYPYPKYSSYADFESHVLHPLPRRPTVRTLGIDLSYGLAPSRMG